MKIPNYGDLKYSFLVPVHNNLDALQRCIESLRNQTYPNYEIIIIDDSLNDDIKNYLQFMEQIDSKIKLSRNINRIGKGQCKNILLKQAIGDYYIFVEATDYVETDLLSRINNSLKNKQVDVLHFNNVVEGATPNQVIKEYNKNKFRYCEMPTGIISGEDALLRWFYNKNQTTTTPWSYCIKESLYDKVEFPNTDFFEDIPVTPILLAKAKTAKGIDYVGYHFMQYDNPNLNASEFDKYIFLAKKIQTLKKVIEQATAKLEKTSISDETKEKIIKDLEERYESRKRKLEEKTKKMYYLNKTK